MGLRGNDDIKVNLTGDGVVTVHTPKYLTVVSDQDMYIGYKPDDENAYPFTPASAPVPPNVPVKKISFSGSEGVYIQAGSDDVIHGAILVEDGSFLAPDKIYEVGFTNGPPSYVDNIDYAAEGAAQQAQAAAQLAGMQNDATNAKAAAEAARQAEIAKQQAEAKEAAEADARSHISFGIKSLIIGVAAVVCVATCGLATPLVVAGLAVAAATILVGAAKVREGITRNQN